MITLKYSYLKKSQVSKGILFFYLLGVFLSLLGINLYYLEGIPHVPDSVAYLFMAKLFAQGQVISAIPVSPQHFDFFPGILDISKGSWLFQYPFGHPVLLAIGALLGLPHMIPPLVGMFVVLLLFLIAKEVFNNRAAIFIAILPLLSPFFLENASSFMSHNTASLYLLLSVYTIVKHQKNNNSIFPLISGISIGLLFNTRPLTAIPFIAGIFFVIILLKKSACKNTLVWYSIGFFVMFLLWLLYNFLITGSLFSSQYYLVNHQLFSVDDSSFEQTLQTRFKNTHILFKNFIPMLYNWPFIITFGLLIIPFVFKRYNRWDIVFCVALFTLPLVYFFYNGTFIMYGPRFWYEITPFVFLLTARSFSILYSYYSKLTLCLFFTLAAFSFGQLFSLIPTKDPDFFSPLSLIKLKGFNFTDSRISKKIEKQNIHNAVIFVKDCSGNWWCYGSVFWRNNPQLNSDIIYAKDLGEEKNNMLGRYYPSRFLYIIYYYTLQLQKIK